MIIKCERYYSAPYVCIDRQEEYVLGQCATYLSAPRRELPPHVGHFDSCSLRELLTLRVAHIGEVIQGLSSMRTFDRPNKRNDSRQRHSIVYYAVDPAT